MAKLTKKQELFCLEYLTDFNATQADVRAGYRNKAARQIGTENLSKPAIKARIAELVKERESKLICTADEALKVVTQIVRGEMSDEVFRTTADGEQVHDGLKASTRDRLKAAEIIMKVNGLFEKNVNLVVDVPQFAGESDLED